MVWQLAHEFKMQLTIIQRGWLPGVNRQIGQTPCPEMEMDVVDRGALVNSAEGSEYPR